MRFWFYGWSVAILLNFINSVITVCFARRCGQMLFLLFFSAFPWGERGQQLEINPPHFTVFHLIHHFAWGNCQAIPSKILNVIGPSSFRSSNWSSLILTSQKELELVKQSGIISWPIAVIQIWKWCITQTKCFTEMRKSAELSEFDKLDTAKLSTMHTKNRIFARTDNITTH